MDCARAKSVNGLVIAVGWIEVFAKPVIASCERVIRRRGRVKAESRPRWRHKRPYTFHRIALLWSKRCVDLTPTDDTPLFRGIGPDRRGPMQSEPNPQQIDPGEVGIAPENEELGQVYKQVVREVLV
jgi:hypothetical protein